MFRVNPYFRNDVSITTNQLFHLQIDGRISLMLILGLPVSIWRCEGWIFIAN